MVICSLKRAWVVLRGSVASSAEKFCQRRGVLARCDGRRDYVVHPRATLRKARALRRRSPPRSARGGAWRPVIRAWPIRPIRRSSNAVIQRRHPWQRFALKELQRCPTAGADEAHLALYAELQRTRRLRRRERTITVAQKMWSVCARHDGKPPPHAPCLHHR